MTTQELRIEAEKLQSLGSKMTIEELISFLEKKEAKKAKKEKRSNKRWARREVESKIVVTERIDDMGEYNRNALKRDLDFVRNVKL